MARTVVVTGGSKGIGLVVAERFAAAGEDVVVTGRSQQALDAAVEKLGVRAVHCDGTSPADVAALSEQLAPRVHVLVNMAGQNTDAVIGATSGESLEELAAAWRANLDANLMSAVLTTTALLPLFAAGGAIVNVGSGAAEYATTSYGVAKAAVSAWTVGLSASHGHRGITVNTVSPGYTADTGFFPNGISEQMVEGLIARTHDKRAGLPDDVAATVEFLASPGARHITGQVIHVNGGSHTTR